MSEKPKRSIVFAEALGAVMAEFPPEMRDTGGQDMVGNWITEPVRNLETTLTAIQTLKKQHTALLAGLRKVRDEYRGAVPHGSTLSERMVFEQIADALTALIDKRDKQEVDE